MSDHTLPTTPDPAGEPNQTQATSAEHTGHTSPTLPAGTRVAQFTITKLLGIGGMGAVYAAEQDRPKRTVALKLIRPGFADERILRRFELEAEVLGRLHHPGIASIHDAGVADTPHGTQPYFAMELVNGVPITRYADDNNLSSRERLALLTRICDAVEHAHQKGVIHRDLKPGNILVNITESTGSTVAGASSSTLGPQPKILDFGVARATDADVQTTTLHTDVGALIGTVPYMSPEQAGGDPAALDTRSDVYALGVVAYQLLAGRLPHDLKNRMIHEAVRIITEEDPAPISSINRSLRGDVDTIVTKALEKEKERRYQSAADLADDIRRYLADEPIAARPPSTLYQLRKFGRRNKVLVAGIAATFLVLVAGIVATAWQAVAAIRARDEARVNLVLAQQRETEAVQARDEAAAINDFLADLLRQADPWKAGGKVTIAEAVARAESLIAETFADQPLVEASVRHTLGQTFQGLGLYDDAATQLDRVIEIRTEILGPYEQSTYAARRDRAGIDILRGEFTKAIAALTPLVENDASLPPDSLERTAARRSLGDALSHSGDWERAEPLFLEAIRMLESTVEPNHPQVIETRNNLGWGYLFFGEIDKAILLFTELVEVQRARFGDEHPKLIVALNGLAQAYEYKRQWDRAEEIYRRTAELGPRTLGEGHPDTVVALIGLANIHFNRGETEQAIIYAERSLQIYRDQLGPDHKYTLIAVHNLANNIRRGGDPDKALAMHTENLERRRRVLGDDHQDVAASLAAIGTCHYANENYEDAERFFRQALDRSRRAVGENTPRVIDNTMNLASVLQKLGRHDEAAPLMREVIAFEREQLDPNHPYLEQDLYVLGEILIDAGDLPAAADAWRESAEIRLHNKGENDPKLAERRADLGAVLTRIEQFEEAESNLVAAGKHYESIDQPDQDTLEWHAVVARRLAELYDAWHTADPTNAHDAKATRWRTTLSALEEQAATTTD